MAEHRALRADHRGVRAAEDDQVRPGLPHDRLARFRRGLGRADRLLPGGPAELVEDPGAQGAGERRRHAGAQGVAHRRRGGRQDLARQPLQCLERPGVAGELAQPRGEVHPGDVGHPGGEHRPSAGRLGEGGDDAFVDALALVGGAAAAEGGVETGVGLQGEEVPPPVAGRPALQVEAASVPGVRDRDAQGQELVEEVDVAERRRQRAALGAEFGAECAGHAVDERGQLRRRGVPAAGAAQVEEPACPAGRAVGGTLLGGQAGVAQSGGGAGLLQQVQPLGQLSVLPFRGQQPQQGAADGGLAPGQFQQGRAVGLPPAGRRLGRAGQRQHLAQVGHLLGRRVPARDGLRQPAQVGRARARRRHTVGREPDEEPAQVPQRRGGRHPGRQPLGVAGEDLRRHGVGQGELEEHGVHACLVEGQRVRRLGLARVDEHLGRVGLLAGGQEDPAGLLVEGRQEVGYGSGEPLPDGLVGGAGLLRP
ncbi:hypothetical protein [Streptomyces sp. NPDC003719]